MFSAAILRWELLKLHLQFQLFDIFINQVNYSVILITYNDITARLNDILCSKVFGG